jgi:AAA15 family ATPase/GTPase
LLARKLIQYFQHPSNNTTGAQLIFATQDATLMDSALFRRDQLWLVEKNREQASECFSLYDFDERPRNTEALQRNYLAGRYGGIPIFGRALERLEDEAS